MLIFFILYYKVENVFCLLLKISQRGLGYFYNLRIQRPYMQGLSSSLVSIICIHLIFRKIIWMEGTEKKFVKNQLLSKIAVLQSILTFWMVRSRLLNSINVYFLQLFAVFFSLSWPLSFYFVLYQFNPPPLSFSN